MRTLTEQCQTVAAGISAKSSSDSKDYRTRKDPVILKLRDALGFHLPLEPQNQVKLSKIVKSAVSSFGFYKYLQL